MCMCSQIWHLYGTPDSRSARKLPVPRVAAKTLKRSIASEPHLWAGMNGGPRRNSASEARRTLESMGEASTVVGLGKVCGVVMAGTETARCTVLEPAGDGSALAPPEDTNKRPCAAPTAPARRGIEPVMADGVLGTLHKLLGDNIAPRCGPPGVQTPAGVGGSSVPPSCSNPVVSSSSRWPPRRSRHFRKSFFRERLNSIDSMKSGTGNSIATCCHDGEGPPRIL
mmetsp:Transcript_11637/g.31197  ORF Transcript_11637/g.31197 Transcript_11637/m.31197 type:complete len:225 (-) Transcript_11637:1450-2124(-)